MKSGNQANESSDRLATAEYVARNIPVWVPVSDNLPSRGAGSADITIAKVEAGTLVTEQFTMPLMKGQMFWYAATDLQGLTPTAVSGKPTRLYANMAPDQYLLPEALKLNDNPEDLKALAEALTEFIIQKQAKPYSPEERSALLDKVQKRVVSDNLEFKDPNDGLLWNKLDALVKEHGVRFGGKSDFQKIAPVLQSAIGKQHVTKIEQQIGQFAVFTIAGPDGSEAKGYGVKDRTPFHNEKKAVLLDSADEKPTLSLYQGHNPAIERQLVMQSKATTKQADGTTVRGDLNFADSDIEHILDFYHNTMGKVPPIPVVVNCTDGIDRTGKTMVALMMLDLYRKDDFTQKGADEQRQLLIGLIEGLKKDRGPFFLKGVDDTAVAVTFGYALIAAQKQLDYQKNLANDNTLNPSIKALLNDQKIVSEPDQLIAKLDTMLQDASLSAGDRSKLTEWKALVEDRSQAYQDFARVNNPESELSKKIDAIPKGPVGITGASALGKVTPIQDAPISEFLHLANEGFDLKTIKSNGKDVFQLAMDQLLKNPTADNLKDMQQLATKLDRPQNAVSEAAVAQVAANQTKENVRGLREIAKISGSESKKSMQAQLVSLGENKNLAEPSRVSRVRRNFVAAVSDWKPVKALRNYFKSKEEVTVDKGNEKDKDKENKADIPNEPAKQSLSSVQPPPVVPASSPSPTQVQRHIDYLNNFIAKFDEMGAKPFYGKDAQARMRNELEGYKKYESPEVRALAIEVAAKLDQPRPKVMAKSSSAPVVFSGAASSIHTTQPNPSTNEQKEAALAICRELIQSMLKQENFSFLKVDDAGMLKRKLSYIQDRLVGLDQKSSGAVSEITRQTQSMWADKQNPLQKMVEIFEGKNVKENLSQLQSQLDQVNPSNKSRLSNH